jgi:gliding motility-associated-like protein
MNSGFYAIKLIAINPGGCSDSLIKPYTVNLPAPVTALFSGSVVSNGTILFTNNSSNFIKSKWDFGDNSNSIIENPLHTFPDITNYNVCLTVFNSLNCPDSVCKELYTGISRIVAVPSGFTPNDDNHNDVLRVRGGPFAEMEFTIYNEWGNLIFSSTQQDIGWDGRYNGEAQPVGVYEYVLRGKTLEDKKITLYGAVNLTR